MYATSTVPSTPEELTGYTRARLEFLAEGLLGHWERVAGFKLDREARPFDMYSDAWRQLYEDRRRDPADAHRLLVALEAVERLQSIAEKL